MSYAEFHKAVRALDNPFVVQVGACDGVLFDPLRPLILERKLHGLLIEPLADVLELCRHNYRASHNYQLLYANLAVADRSGPVQLRRIPLAKLRHPGDCGIALATARHHNLLTPEIAEAHQLTQADKDFYRDAVETVTVPAFPLKDILAGYGITRVDTLVVDVEGMEWDVIQSFDLPAWRPSVLLVEHVTMSPHDKAELCRYVQEQNYAVMEMGTDWLFTRREQP